MDRPAAAPAKPAKLVGGAPCLDFVNTVSWRGRAGGGRDRLVDYRALVGWAEQAGILGREEAALARRTAASAPDRAAAVLAEAAALREAIARLLQGIGDAGDVARLNRLLARAPARAALVPAGGGLVWSDPAAGAPADPLWRPVWPVLWSAGDLLTGPLRARVRRCADPQCGWMFLDTSRSRPRLWCSMADCGNRAKARRHYARKRGSGAPGRDAAMIGRS